MYYVDYNIHGKDGEDCIVCPVWNDVLKVIQDNPDAECDIRTTPE